MFISMFNWRSMGRRTARNTMMLCGTVSRWGRWGERLERLIEQQNQTKLRRSRGRWGGGKNGCLHRGPPKAVVTSVADHCQQIKPRGLLAYVTTKNNVYTQMQELVSIFSRLKTCSLCHLSRGMRERTEGH